MKAFKFIITLALFVPLAFNAQCRAFTKKTCRPQIEPYIHNGQMNNAVLYPEDNADIILTFYSGQDYRLVVCSEEQLGDVTFKVTDMDRKTIFDSKDKKTNTFDFKVNSTRQLIVTLSVPKSKNTHELDFNGCVSVLVGFKN